MGSDFSDLQNLAQVKQLVLLLQEQGTSAWLVGGCIRDSLMGLEVHDLDVAIDAPSEQIKRIANQLKGFGAESIFALSDAFGAYRLTFAGLQVDITPLQAETIQGDLALRDLTINAMAIQLNKVDLSETVLIDPYAGRVDIEKKLLRAVSDSSFSSDPVRIARMARFQSTFGFEIESTTWGLAADAVAMAHKSASERWAAELLGTAQGTYIAKAVQFLQAVKLVDQLTGQVCVEQVSDKWLLLGEDVVLDQSLVGEAVNKEQRFALLLFALCTKAQYRALVKELPFSKALSRFLVASLFVRTMFKQLLTMSRRQRYEAVRPFLANVSDALELVVGLPDHSRLSSLEAAEARQLLADARRWQADPPRSPISAAAVKDTLCLVDGPDLGFALNELAITSDLQPDLDQEQLLQLVKAKLASSG